jgi:type VI secretion system secreted protein Hcp
MAIDTFMKLDGVAGESRDKTHKGEIEVLSWSWGVSNQGSMHHGSGGGTGKANIQDLSFTKYTDKATPTLTLFSCNGKHIKTALLTVRKASGDTTPLEYLKIKLSEIIVTNVSMAGHNDERITETVTLNFAKVALDYVPQSATGDPEAAIPMTWDVAANVK